MLACQRAHVARGLCQTHYQRKYRRKLSSEEARDRNIRQKYPTLGGIEGYRALVAEQGGVCKVCKRKPSDRYQAGRDRRGRTTGARCQELHVDHDHKTGMVRGLLCTFCNVMLGQASDDAEILRAGAAYLELFDK